MKKTHGKTKTKEFRAWQHMINRCYNKRDKTYPEYGGRGICVCDRWRSSFENFYSDMGKAPTKNHSVDRYPNNETGNYEPTNCRWALPPEQSRNRRSNRIYEINGEKKCLIEWCEIYNVNYGTTLSRLKRGYSILEALTPPKENWDTIKNKTILEYSGESGDIMFWSKKTGLNYYTILGRHRKGWSVDETINTPSERNPNKSITRPKNAGNKFRANSIKEYSQKIIE